MRTLIGIGLVAGVLGVCLLLLIAILVEVFLPLIPHIPQPV